MSQKQKPKTKFNSFEDLKHILVTIDGADKAKFNCHQDNQQKLFNKAPEQRMYIGNGL